jgi:multimeric flavodoxin WrbA
MKVLAFQGSPRKKGNTEVLLQAIERGIQEAGGEMETVRLYGLAIQPCIGCGGCDKTGKCVLEDDMTGLYEQIIAAKRIIIASPVYFYNVTAQAKAFIDRTQALWSRKYLMKKKGQWQADPERKGYFVSVAATKGQKVFEGSVLTAKYAFDAMDMMYGGELLVKQVDRIGEMATHKDELQKAEEFGKSIIM